MTGEILTPTPPPKFRRVGPFSELLYILFLRVRKVKYFPHLTYKAIEGEKVCTPTFSGKKKPQYLESVNCFPPEMKKALFHITVNQAVACMTEVIKTVNFKYLYTEDKDIQILKQQYFFLLSYSIWLLQYRIFIGKLCDNNQQVIL